MHLSSRAANPSFANEGNGIHGESEGKNPQEYSNVKLKSIKRLQQSHNNKKLLLQ